MRKPRIAPLQPEEWSSEIAEFLGRPVPGRPNAPVSTFLATMARHPRLLLRWAKYSATIARAAQLPLRSRELAILRTGWLCKGEYEWGHHVRSARAAGVTAQEIEQIIAGPEDPGWDPFDAAVVRSVDELHDKGAISDDTWQILAEQWNDQQLLELPLLVGHYHGVAWLQNSLRVPLDPDIEGLAAH